MQDTSGQTKQGADTYGGGDGSGYGAAGAGAGAGMGAGMGASGYGGGDSQQQVWKPHTLPAWAALQLRSTPGRHSWPWQTQVSCCCGSSLQPHVLHALQALSSLSGGDTLSPGQTLASPDGQSKLVFQDDGNLVVRSERRRSWAQTDKLPALAALLSWAAWQQCVLALCTF